MTGFNICDLCKKEQCGLQPCEFEPKYNLCPCCFERVLRTEPRCTKCGYEFDKHIGGKE